MSHQSPTLPLVFGNYGEQVVEGSTQAAMTSVFGQLVVGPPGSGKTTYCHVIGEYLKSIGRKVAIVNIGK
uniref:GPN-loop GTPase 2 n=2 Tax=Timema TaxID=61471 RepID=A0A7R9FWX1_TIMSH|nr:unnamed protein product [Timema shepardi]CAD7575097.1 unnamed protein product [Timema californicum]